MHKTVLNEYYANARKRFTFLQYLANKFGDFEVQSSFIRDDGEKIYLKRKTVVELSEMSDPLTYKIRHRRVLDCEIVVDLDEMKNYSNLVKFIDHINKHYPTQEYYLFKTGSKGYHLHLFFHKDPSYRQMSKKERWQIREKVALLLTTWGFDSQKASTRTMVALEFAPHWKTGNQKTLIEKKGDFYDVN
jgi:hypothetical protein